MQKEKKLIPNLKKEIQWKKIENNVHCENKKRRNKTWIPEKNILRIRKARSDTLKKKKYYPLTISVENQDALT